MRVSESVCVCARARESVYMHAVWYSLGCLGMSPFLPAGQLRAKHTPAVSHINVYVYEASLTSREALKNFVLKGGINQ